MTITKLKNLKNNNVKSFDIENKWIEREIERA